MKRAAIYLRVSTTDQNYERQRMELKALAKALGYEIKYVFEEKKSAVLNMDTREELTKMRKLTKEDVDRIFIWDITRLSRKSIDFINLVNEFSEKGICLHFKDKNIETLDNNGKLSAMATLYLHILGAFAQMDAENLKAKFLSGKERSLAIGNSYTYNAPYGYYLKDKKLCIKEEEAKIVRQFYNWYIEGKTLKEIEIMLNANKVPTKSGVLWSKSMVFQMLKNPVYKGEPIYINKRKDENGKKEAIKVRTFSAPVIVEPVIWEMAQNQRVKNRSFADKRKNVSNAILRGLLTCGRCGRACIVGFTGIGYENYFCGDRRASINTKTGCKNGGINAFYLDYVVWEAIKNIYAYKSFKEKFNEEREKNIKQLEDNKRQIEKYINTKAEQEGEKQKVRKGYRLGIYDDSSAADAMAEINSTINKIEQLILELEANNKLLERKINQKEEKYNFEDKQLTYKEKALIAKDLIESIKIHTISFYEKIVTVELYMGLQYNLLINTNSGIRKYAIVDDGTVTFNNPFKNNNFLSSKNIDIKIPDFDVTSNNNELFGEEILGGYSFKEIWKILDRYGYLKELPAIDKAYLHKEKKPTS